MCFAEVSRSPSELQLSAGILSVDGMRATRRGEAAPSPGAGSRPCGLDPQTGLGKQIRYLADPPRHFVCAISGLDEDRDEVKKALQIWRISGHRDGGAFTPGDLSQAIPEEVHAWRIPPHAWKKRADRRAPKPDSRRSNRAENPRSGSMAHGTPIGGRSPR